MNILYLSARGGGLDTNVRVLAPQLVRSGHRVSVLYLSFPGATHSDVPPIDGCRVHQAAAGSWHYYFHRATLGRTHFSKIIRTIEYGYSLANAVRRIHRQTAIDLFEMPEGFLPARSLPSALFVRLHSAEWTWRRMLGEGIALVDSFEAKLEVGVLHRATAISSPSQMLADYIGSQCRKPIAIIPYPVDTDQFIPSTTRSDPPVILFVGRVEKRKGADILMRAIPYVREKFPDCEFVFAGAVSEELKDQFAAQPAQVRFLGPRPRAELVSWYQRTAIFVAPSLWDNSPNTIYEAMACGAPVIATRVGGIPELVEDGVTGLLVPPRDADALAEAIRTLLGDSSRRGKMGRCGRDKAVANYSIEKILKQTLAFYERALTH